MHGLGIILGLALGLILVGIVMAVWGKNVTPALVGRVVHIVGICLIVVGLVLLLTPVLVWISNQLRSMLEA